MSNVNVVALSVFIFLFLVVTVIGFVAARWRRGDLNHLNEWSLGGRSFGTVITWFLLGGDLYTAYTFIAVPGLVYGAGAIGFYAVPYTLIVYPFVFAVMPRMWAVAKKHNYITASDFIRGRFESPTLALAVAFTGILATMPYIALQLVGIQVVLQAMGLQGTGLLKDLPLFVAFVVLAAYTYTSGLRAPALIALVKDALIYIAVLAIVIYVPSQIGGFSHIFASVPKAKLTLAPAQIPAYWTLALGSAFALFLYPHALTGIFSSKSGTVIRRNAALLPAYSIVLGLLALVGFMAIGAGIKTTNTSLAVPLLVNKFFPDPMIGLIFAGIAIGALVPAAVMSIAASSLFTRNIYKEYFRANASPKEEATVAKLVSLIVKFGALVFVLALPISNAIQFQLLGGVWILQIFPPVIFGLYTRWFHRWGLILGWLGGMITGSYMVFNNFAHGISSTTYVLTIMGTKYAVFAGMWALIVNLAVTVVISLVFNLVKVSNGKDQTSAADYHDLTVEKAAAGIGAVVEPEF